MKSMISFLRTLRPLRRLALAAVAIAATVAVGGAASATWSIIIVDTATGEVAIGCATCLENFDVELWVPVMRVGLGGGCSQSSIDSDGKIRQAIWTGLENGDSPTDILNAIKVFDPFYANRQIGIVDLTDRARTYTGSGCGAFANGVKGHVGTITYAIQGNVLTGQPVIDMAEQAILNTTGDLAGKLMKAMEAAAMMGGDGRCSCNPSAPDSCGSPPTGFTYGVDKSAHCGFVMVSRIGDSDGNCDKTNGCSTGAYYLNLNVAYQTQNDADPVVKLRSKFNTWRNGLKGRPDHILSTKSLTLDKLPGNGTASTSLDITAIDWKGVPVGHGGAIVTIHHAAGSAGLATFGAPVDNGDGTYTVPVTAGVGQGHDLFEVVLDDGVSPVTLFPLPAFEETATLTSDVAALSAAAGGTANLALSGPADAPPQDYLLLCSASGTSPGIALGGVVVPLNFDGVVVLSYLLRNGANFVNTDGTLLADGTQAAQFVAHAGELTPLIGLDLAFAFFTHGPAVFASNPVLVNVQN